MDTDLERLCPYAPYTSVLMVIRHMRARDLKELVTSQLITTIGVAEGNASRTIQTLRFLDLLDEGGYITPNFKAIGNAPDEEYPELLAQTLREAYRHVFMTLDPATASDQQFENAFRYYQPRAQRGRMIMLFKGLCREAGIIAGGAPEAIVRSRTASPKPANITKKAQPKSADRLVQLDHEQEPNQPATPSTLPTSQPAPVNTSQELTILEGLLYQLPLKEKRWTESRRDKWIQAMTATVNFLFEVDDLDKERGSQYTAHQLEMPSLDRENQVPYSSR